MTTLSCSFSWEGLQEVMPILQALGTGLWDAASEGQNFAAALDVAQADAHELYIGYLLGRAIPGHGALKNPSPSLARSVTSRSEGFMRYLGNSSDNAKWIEEGTKRTDMKKALSTSQKARRAKDGSLYLIIPFRHFTPMSSRQDAMPREIYMLAASMKRSYQFGDGFRLSATGYFVPKWRYQYGDRLPNKKGLEALGFDSGTARRYGGMLKFGEAGHSSYVTFRVMSEKSAGWIRPAQPAYKPLETALQVAATRNAEAFARAFEADIPAIIQAAMSR